MNNITPLLELTEQQFNDLKKANLLNVIYPNAPKSFDKIPGRKPKQIKKPDLTNIKLYLEEITSSKTPLKDEQEYLYEEVMKAFYGEEIWEYFRQIKRK